jgi:hypothetical protein
VWDDVNTGRVQRDNFAGARAAAQRAHATQRSLRLRQYYTFTADGIHEATLRRSRTARHDSGGWMACSSLHRCLCQMLPPVPPSPPAHPAPRPSLAAPPPSSPAPTPLAAHGCVPCGATPEHAGSRRRLHTRRVGPTAPRVCPGCDASPNGSHLPQMVVFAPIFEILERRPQWCGEDLHPCHRPTR